MRILFLLFFSGMALFSFSQSPYLSVRVRILTVNSANYKIEMKLCGLKNPSSYKDVFGHDTSKIDLALLSAEDFACGPYMNQENDSAEIKYNGFDWGNQKFGYETILVFRISNVSSRNYHKPMYVVLPVKYQSFVTYIELLNLIVKDGSILYLDDLPDSRTKSGRLLIRPALANYSPVNPEKFPLKLRLD